MFSTIKVAGGEFATCDVSELPPKLREPNRRAGRHRVYRPEIAAFYELPEGQAVFIPSPVGESRNETQRRWRSRLAGIFTERHVCSRHDQARNGVWLWWETPNAAIPSIDASTRTFLDS